MPVAIPGTTVTRLLHEFRVNSALADYSGLGGPSVASDGSFGFFFAWSGLLNGSNEGIDSNGSDILGRFMTLTRQSIQAGPDFRINTELRDGQYSPSVAGGGSSNNSFTVVYQSGEQNDLPGSYVASQTFNYKGVPQGAEYFSNESMYHNNPHVSVDYQGNYAVVSSQEFDYELEYHQYNGGISTLSFGGESFAPLKSSAIIELENGKKQELIWSGYVDADAALSGEGARGIYAQTVLGSKLLLDEPILLVADHAGNASINNIEVADMEYGYNDTLVIVYQKNDSDQLDVSVYDRPDHDVYSVIFTPANGRVIGGGKINIDSTGDQSAPAVAAFHHGYVVTWVDSSGDGSGSCIMAQVFYEDGKPRGDAFIVNERTVGNQTAPSIAAFGYEDFIITWASPTGIQAATFTASTIPLDSILSGGITDDVIFGTSANDTVKGLAGNDKLTGEAGNDTVLGGAGNDTLRGDGGDDLLQGGDGNDMLLGGMGFDKLAGGADADIFLFRSLNEIGNGGTLGTSDVITDMQSGVDRIDLTRLHLDGPDAIHFSHYLAYTVVNIDADHNGTVDASLLVKGNIAMSDFVL